MDTNLSFSKITCNTLLQTFPFSPLPSLRATKTWPQQCLHGLCVSALTGFSLRAFAPSVFFLFLPKCQSSDIHLFFTLHIISYKCLYSILIVQRWKGSQMGFPSRLLHPNIINSQRLQNITVDTVIFVLLPTWLSEIPHTHQSVHPVPPLKYLFLHLKIFSRVLKSLEREERSCCVLLGGSPVLTRGAQNVHPQATSSLQVKIYFSGRYLM